MRSSYRLLVVCLLSLVSCNRNISKYDDNQVFRYNEHANITTLDPAFAKDLRTIWATNQLFNGLVQLNDQLEVAVPGNNPLSIFPRSLYLRENFPVANSLQARKAFYNP